MRQVSQRKDVNHDDIVDEYRKQQCAVVSLARVGNGCPDLLVLGYGRLSLVEVKTPKGPLKPAQETFARVWPVRVVRSRADVFAHVAELAQARGDRGFVEALETPPEPNARLKALAKRAEMMKS